MQATFPILPLAASATLRGLTAILAPLGAWLKAVTRARQNRAQARALASIDSRMLADMGITRADVQDAFSEPFWEDPTALLRERALERRLGRRLTRANQNPQLAEFNRGLRLIPADNCRKG
ncbi:MAG: DUF1127 domain-containing protein [Pseudolabrys sp.]|nr:DUF1127 domain-containing protein [Pseudolabrys sp.]